MNELTKWAQETVRNLPNAYDRSPEPMSYEDFEWVVEHCPGYFLHYYWNKFCYGIQQSGLCYYDGIDVFLPDGILDYLETEEADYLRPFFDLSAQLNHINYGGRLNKEDTFFSEPGPGHPIWETFNDPQEYIKPYMEAFYKWAQRYQHIREEWLEELSLLKKERIG